MDALLKFNHVSKEFTGNKRQVRALDDISFTVGAGQFIALVGPTGCGKSTILRLAAGLDRPTVGEVLYAGTEVTGPGTERGLVFQAYNSFPWLSVRENVAFGLQKSNGDGRERVDKLLADVGLADFADQFPKALSGGMRQRVAIARSIIVKPNLLLLDEPFGALDERTRGTMQELLLRIAEENHCTVLLVTHDIREAILLSDRLIMLQAHPGRVFREFVSTLPKPRSRSQLKTAEFNDLYDSILENFPA